MMMQVKNDKKLQEEEKNEILKEIESKKREHK